jgi:hypothetical protein
VRQHHGPARQDRARQYQRDDQPQVRALLAPDALLDPAALDELLERLV